MKHNHFTRKVISLLLVFFMVLPMLQPLSAYADNSVTVYIDPVSGSDSNTGLSEEQPVKTVEKAYEPLQAAGGTLVFLSDLTMTASKRFPACSYPVTITSKTGNEGIVSSESVLFGGDTTLKNMKVRLTSANGAAFLGGEGHTFVIGEGMNSIPCIANSSGNKYYFSLLGGLRSAAGTGANMTVLSGTWRGIFAGSYNKAFSGEATLSLSNCTATKIAPAYSSTNTGNVTINLNNVDVTSAIYYSNETSGSSSGNVTINITGSVSAPKLCAGKGSISGNVNVNLEGGSGAVEALTGNEANTTLTLKSGTIDAGISGWGSAVIDVAAEKTLTLAGQTDVDSVTCAGTLAFKGVASLNTPLVNGTVNCTFDKVLKNHLYITAPAGSSFVFPENSGLTEDNGQWIIHDMENFAGLMVQADSDVTMKFYKEYSSTVITPYAQETSDGVTKYYFPNALGKYRYLATKTGCYSIYQDIYMTEAEQAVCTVEQVVMEEKAGNGWEPAAPTLRSDEADAAINNKDELWWENNKDSLVSPFFTNTDRATHQMTTQEELETFITAQDDACEHMYVFNLGQSGKHDLSIPVAIFTETDLSGVTTLEQAAEELAKNGKPILEYRAQMHGIESAAGEGALNVIHQLTGDYGSKVIETIDLYVIPRLNPDGAYIFKREVASGIDPNRDLLRLETTEMQLHQELFLLMQPEMIIDAHERGYKYVDADMGVGVAMTMQNSDAFWQTTKALADEVFTALEEQELNANWYSDDVNSINPNISRGYAGNAGTLFVLMETIGYDMGTQAYEERVISQIIGAKALISYVAEHAEEIQTVVAQEKASFVTSGATYEETDRIALNTKRVTREDLAVMVDMFDMGDGTVTPTLRVPGMYDTAERDRVAPTAYVLPADLDNIEDILVLMERHGIAYDSLPAGSMVQLQQYTGTVEAAELTEEKAVIFANGAYAFCMNQTTRNILALLMEPDVGDDGDYEGPLAQSGLITADDSGSFPIYRYIRDLNTEGKIDYGTVIPDAPEDLTTKKATAAGNDGAITGLDSQKCYEYRSAGATEYTAVPAGSTQITGLAEGVYYVRYQATADTLASADAICLLIERVTVYVSDDNGSNQNNGYAQSAPVKTLEAAYAQISAVIGSVDDASGSTIVLLDDYYLATTQPYDLPSHSYPVTIVAQEKTYGITFETGGATADNVLNLNGPTKLDAMTLTYVGKGTSKLGFLCANGNPLEIGNQITCVPQGDYYMNLVGGSYANEVADASMTVLGGNWRNVYAGGYRASSSGTARLVMRNSTVSHLIQTAYLNTTAADVYMDLENVTVDSIYCGHAYSGHVTGDVTLTLREGVTVQSAVYTGSRDKGNMTGTVTVVADGADLSAVSLTNGCNNATGTVAKGVLTYVSGTVVAKEGFDEVNIDTSAGGTVTVPAEMTVNNVVGGGTINLPADGLLTVSGTATGTTKLVLEDAAMGTPILRTDSQQAPAAFVYADAALKQTAEEDAFLWYLQEATDAKAVTVTQDGTFYFQSIAEAISAYDSDGGSYIQLQANVEDPITVNKEVRLDLNGHSIAKVEGSGTLYCMDAETDDFDVEYDADTNKYFGYGKIVAKDDSVKIYGVPAGTIPTTDTETYPSGKLDGYLMVTEDDGISFHRVNLQLTAMTLRAKNDDEKTCNPSVYYKSAFAGDQLVAQNVESFGVALSKTEMPDEDNMGVTNKYSEFDSFKAGSNEDDEKTSTLLYGVMKETNGDMTNEDNANRAIFGRAYIKLKNDAGYVFGVGESRTLKQQVIDASDIFARLDETQQQKLLTMFDTYRSILTDWDVQNLKDAVNDEVRILGIGNSFTGDSMTLLGEVYKAEQPNKKLTLGYAYYSGCTLALHMKHIKGNMPVYVYYRLNTETGEWEQTPNSTLEYCINAESWNIVTMQEGSSPSRESLYGSELIGIQSYVNRNLGYRPDYLWNMTWAYPVEDDGVGVVTINDSSTFLNNYGGSQMRMYEMTTETVQEKIIPLVNNGTFRYLLPSGTAIQNANADWNDWHLYRDDKHLNDYGRYIVAYTYYCVLNGITADELTTLNLTTIPAHVAKAGVDIELSDEQVAVALKAVKAALEKNFETYDTTAGTYVPPVESGT